MTLRPAFLRKPRCGLKWAASPLGSPHRLILAALIKRLSICWPNLSEPSSHMSQGLLLMHQARILKALDRHARIGASIAAILGFLIGTAATWIPSVQIDTGPIIDSSSIFGTEFRFWNSGRLPVYDIEMVCNVDARPIIFVKNQKVERWEKLPVRHSAHSSCGISAPNMQARALYRIRVNYSWPLHLRRTWAEQTFTAERTADGHIIVSTDTF
jgi:hypothetical protein